MSADWLIGEAARLSVAVTDVASAAIDPAALRLKVKSPAGAIATYVYGVAPEIVRDGVGLFHADIALPTSGQWIWRWETDAPNAGAFEGLLSVQRSRL